MINLDERYHSYLHSNKSFCIDGICEKVRSYGFRCDESTIVGYYVVTENWVMNYNLKEQFVSRQKYEK
jgi:hypothetical protein